MWKFPSPTWPTIGAVMSWRWTASCACMTLSARREIGTQTSVAKALAPGTSASDAQYAPCRAAHSSARPSGVDDHRKSEPPKDDASSWAPAAASSTPAVHPDKQCLNDACMQRCLWHACSALPCSCSGWVRELDQRGIVFLRV